MEIKTTRNVFEDEAGPPPAPEKSRYLRRQTVQKVRQSPFQSSRFKGAMASISKGLLLFVIAAFIFSIFNYAYTSEKLKLRTIVFHGCRHLDCAALEQSIRPSLPENILTIDLHKLRRRLESEPWVKQAEIRRTLPSELVIHIRERVPSVLMEINHELTLADEDGVLLDTYASKYGKLDVPIFRGLAGNSVDTYQQKQEENSARVRLGKKMLSELESGSDLFVRSISEVDLSDTSNVRLLLVDEAAEILLGDRDFLKRFQTFVANSQSFQEVKSKYEITAVDLRFDNQIIYKPRKGPGRDREPGVSAIASR